MTVIAFVFILLLTVPVSLLSVRYENRFIDRFFLIFNQITMSIPPFFIGIIFTVLFGLIFHFFTPGDYISYTESVSDFIGYLILPSLAIALPKAAMTIKMFRNSLITEMHQDYVRTARAKGATEKVVIWKHVLKNALLPVITQIGMNLGLLLCGAVVAEQLFSVQGIGSLIVSRIT